VIGYLDTSAIVPLLVAEPTSAACRRFWDDADDVVSCRIAYVEAAAALAQANRTGRLDAVQHEQARKLLDVLWAELDVIDVDDRLVRAAADAAHESGLRGYDVVHCVAAEHLLDDDLVAAAGDQQLLRAWRGRGIAVYSTGQAP
jgi:predicted nucleic acid-binding protein